MNFLLVDDDGDFLHLVTILVNVYSPSSVIALAHDGEEALTLITKSSPPDIIITDITMPRLDGNELCNNIKAKFGNSIKIIAMTGSPSEEINADFDFVLKKPFTYEILFAAIDGVMNDKNLGTFSLKKDARQMPRNYSKTFSY